MSILKIQLVRQFSDVPMMWINIEVMIIMQLNKKPGKIGFKMHGRKYQLWLGRIHSPVLKQLK